MTEEDEEAVLDELNEILSGSEETTGIVNKLDNLPEVPESLGNTIICKNLISLNYHQNKSLIFLTDVA